MNVLLLIALLILIISCAFVLYEAFDVRYPMPLTDWLYGAVIKAEPSIARSFVQVETPGW
jgi:hypothetical protein